MTADRTSPVLFDHAEKDFHVPPKVETCLSRVAVFSRGMVRIPHLASFLGADRLTFRPSDRASGGVDCVVGWGRKPNTDRARRYAARHGLPYLAVEDGFLRSLDLGARGAAPLSLVVDDLGSMYYDASRPSRLEQLLDHESGFDEETMRRAAWAMRRIVEKRLSKYNAAPDLPADALPHTRRRRVLIVDQTFGDMSIVHGLADAGSFARMLEAARDEHPGAEFFVKPHPDTVAGHKRGYLSGTSLPEGVALIEQDANPLSLLPNFDHVYTVSSQLGFEALLAGIPVTCFGMPFYAGWGATDDRTACMRRRRKRSVSEIFAAAYLRYARYIDPITGTRCDISRVIDHLILAREVNEANRGTTVCFGVPRWKRAHVRPFLESTGGRLIFARGTLDAGLRGATPGCRIIVWGRQDPRALDVFATRIATRPVRVEDGFIRSVGLGSDLIQAASLVVDGRGIYYDPGATSDLEEILQTAAFTPELVARAARLRQDILDAGISKYNVGDVDSRPTRPPAGSRMIILVPGQVEGDASIRLGCRGISTNLGLLEAVRSDYPDAYIIYKPHPDVVTRNRRGQAREDGIVMLSDEIRIDADIHDCIGAVDEVHTMTSLTGFEALLREKRVVTYGQPFYAGWGLTVDRTPVTRRTRRLTLDEFVAGVLVLSPRYYDWDSGNVCECETIVARLIARRAQAQSKTATSLDPGVRRQLRRARHLLAGWLRTA